MTRKVTATDDSLAVYSQPDLASITIAQIRKGAGLELGDSTIREEREWIGATLEDGRAGYVLGPAARNHTTLGAGAILDGTDPDAALKQALKEIIGEKPAPPRARGLTPQQEMVVYGLICAMGITFLVLGGLLHNDREGRALGIALGAIAVGAIRFIRGLIRWFQQ